MRSPAFATSVLALSALLAATPAASAQETYTFEALSLNSMINGQDNWVDKPGQGYAAISLGTGLNGTKVVRHVPTVAFNEFAYLSRVNDGSFSFPPLFPSQTEAVLQFDCTGDHIALFALGTDLDGDGILGAGELGPAFGTWDRNFRVTQAGFGASHEVPLGAGNSKEDWYRLRLELNLAANGGQGSGSLSYKNLTDADPTFIPVAALQDVNLGLGALNPAAAPATWNTLWLQLMTGGSNIPHADNLVPNVEGLGVPFCFGDGSALPCPCGNASTLGLGKGCRNSTGAGAWLLPTGAASVTADTLSLAVFGATPNEFGIFVQNTGGSGGAPFYNGVLCLPADAHLIRHYAPPGVLPTLTDAAGLGVNPQPFTAGDYLGDTQPGATLYYQFWYRDTPGYGATCTAGANLSSGCAITWTP